MHVIDLECCFERLQSKLPGHPLTRLMPAEQSVVCDSFSMFSDGNFTNRDYICIFTYGGAPAVSITLHVGRQMGWFIYLRIA
jgi:hypothetical protein